VISFLLLSTEMSILPTDGPSTREEGDEGFTYDAVGSVSVSVRVSTYRRNAKSPYVSECRIHPGTQNVTCGAGTSSSFSALRSSLSHRVSVYSKYLIPGAFTGSPCCCSYGQDGNHDYSTCMTVQACMTLNGRCLCPYGYTDHIDYYVLCGWEPFEEFPCCCVSKVKDVTYSTCTTKQECLKGSGTNATVEFCNPLTKK